MRYDAERDVSRSLWIGEYWSDERQRDFTERTGRSPVAVFGQRMEGWPVPAVPERFHAKVQGYIGTMESVWGLSVENVANAMGLKPSSLAWRVVMNAMGHGVAADDDGEMPDGLTAQPLPSIESIADEFLPAPDDWAGNTDAIA